MSLCENNIFYVYALVDPINRLPFYIGKGKKNRMFVHLKSYDKNNAKKHKIINLIRNLGHEPVALKIMDNLSEEEALNTEMFYIKEFKEVLNLTNFIIQPPSRAGKKLSEEHKEKLRRFNKGKKLTEDHKRKIGMSNKLRFLNSL